MEYLNQGLAEKNTNTTMTHEAFTRFALYTVWICAAIGITAAVSKYFTMGSVEPTTLVFSLIALLLSIPTYRKWRRKSLAKTAE